MKYKNLSIKALALLAELQKRIISVPMAMAEGFGAEELRSYGDEAKAELLQEGVLVCVSDDRYLLAE